MTLIDQLLRIARAYCGARKISSARLSTLLFNDGKRLGQIERGADLRTGVFERARQWLSDHWPADAAWPDGVDRPEPAAPAQPQRTAAEATP